MPTNVDNEDAKKKSDEQGKQLANNVTKLVVTLGVVLLYQYVSAALAVGLVVYFMVTIILYVVSLEEKVTALCNRIRDDAQYLRDTADALRRFKQ